MESSEPESVSWLQVIGKYICFFAFACLFFTVPALVQTVWQTPFFRGDEHLLLGFRFLCAFVIAASVAFWAGLLFVFRRPWAGTAILIGLLIGCWIFMVTFLPDR
jgi:hypothetical protein